MYLFRDCPIHCSSRRSVRGVSPPNKAPFPRNQSVQRSLSSVVTWSAHQPLSHSWNLVFLRANTSGLTWSGVRECVCMWVTWIIINSMYMYCIAGNFRGAKYSWFSWLKVWPRIFTHEWSDLAYLYLQCKQQPKKYYRRNVSILLNHEYFVPQKWPAIYTV